VNGLNQAGQVAGFFYVAGVQPPHAFFYDHGALTDLGTFGGTVSEALGINNAGQIAGEAALADGQMHPFIYAAGSVSDLGTLGGTTASAAAINDAGDAAGQSTTAGNAATVAFLYTGGSMTNLGTLGGNYSAAVALNNFRIVVGASTLAGGATHGFVYANGIMNDVGTLGGDYSSAFALNDSGTVVGESSLTNGDTHAFVYSGGVLGDLSTLGGTYSSASAINTNGQVIGFATTAGDQELHAFIFAAGTLTDLGTLGGNYSGAAAINNLGQVVGAALTADGTQHAFLWQKGKLLDLNTILPANSGWELNGAQFINDSGRIVGFGGYNGLSQWFIMDLASPNSPPMAIAGPDLTADCQAQVTLNGSGSTDPNGDPLSFEWTMGGALLSTNSSFSAVFPLGTNLVTLKVTDPCGASSQTNLQVRVVDTAPPTGSCPPAVTIAADINCQARVPNLLSQLVAQDNCTPAGSLILTQDPAPGALVGLGPHLISFTVTDTSGNAAACSTLCTVVDNDPPSILSMPSPITISAGANCQGAVPNVLPGVVASDNCTAPNLLVMTQSPPAGTLLPRGQYAIAVTVKDASGNAATGNVLLSITNTTGPVIQSLAANPSILWPPNGQMVPVTVSVTVSDSCDPGPIGRIVSITCDEAPAPGEIQITGPLSASLAASKDRNGTARTYTITVQCSDSSGNASTASLTVVVPANSGNWTSNLPSSSKKK
jgi:probable HAF family extracellular repeat protein